MIHIRGLRLLAMTTHLAAEEGNEFTRTFQAKVSVNIIICWSSKIFCLNKFRISISSTKHMETTYRSNIRSCFFTLYMYYVSRMFILLIIKKSVSINIHFISRSSWAYWTRCLPTWSSWAATSTQPSVSIIAMTSQPDQSWRTNPIPYCQDNWKTRWESGWGICRSTTQSGPRSGINHWNCSSKILTRFTFWRAT